MSVEPRPKNKLKTALIMASIALAFFVGIIVKVMLFGHK